MREYISPELRKSVLDRDRNQCRYCGTKNPPFHLDHVYPVIKGGETSAENLVTSCSNCNSRKHSSVGMWPKPIGYFENRKLVSPLGAYLCLTGVLVTLGGSGLYVYSNHSIGFYTILAGVVVELLGLHLRGDLT